MFLFKVNITPGSWIFLMVKKYLDFDVRWGEYASAWLEKDRKDRAAEEKDRWKHYQSKVGVLKNRILKT